MPIRESDHGWKRIAREVRANARTTLAIGIQGAQGSRKHVDSELTVAEIATLNEHGTSGIPARSFLRSTVDTNEPKYRKVLRGVADAVIAGKLDARTGLELVGEIIVGDVKQAIADGIPPPNAPSTIAAKGSSVPLIDSGQMRNSVTADIREG
jgi:hypothetical protein